MPFKNYVLAQPMSIIAGADLTNAYQKFNNNPLPASFLLIVTNDSSEIIYISFDGITDHDVCLVGESMERYFQTNASPNNQQALLQGNTTVWVKSPGGAGDDNVYLSVYYQPEF